MNREDAVAKGDGHRKRKEPIRRYEPASAAPRATKPTNAPVADYPDAWTTLRSPDLHRLVRAAVRAAVAGGAVALSTLATGCAEPPVCTTDRTGELALHGERAVNQVAELELGDALTQIGVGMGVTRHPIAPYPGGIMMPGEMVAPAPILSPTPPVTPAPSTDGTEPVGGGVTGALLNDPGVDD